MKFSPAKREAIRLLLGVAGGTGSGKTYSALRLARGLAGDQTFALIDTENGRALQYADEFAFDHGPLEAPFTSERYLEAIQAADAAGYPVIVVDSASHEYAGMGGLLDRADAELERMGGQQSAKLASFVAPKAAHRKFRDELLRLRAHVILCYRAEPKVEMRKDAKGRWEIVPKPSLVGLDGWIPIAEKNDPYELTVSFLLTADAPGIPKPIKLPKPLAPLVPLDAPLAESVGAALGEWARGDDTPAPKAAATSPAAPEPSPGAGPAHDLSEPITRAFYALEGRLTLERVLVKFPRLAEVQTLPFRLDKVLLDATPEEAAEMLKRLTDYRARVEAGV